MVWYAYIAALFARMFLIKASRTSCRAFPATNFSRVDLGFANLAVGGVLVYVAWCGTWPLSVTALRDGLLISLHLANQFSKVRDAALHP